ncbi:MAG: LLM class flavin-dependent oxidoreductase [Mycobacterium sp.]
MTDLHLAVALDGYGWHPQAWRQTLAADPAALPVTSGRYWSALARTAESGYLDFLTIDDTLAPQPGRKAAVSPRRLAGRADAVLTAARIAPATAHIGLIPVATVTHTEPFHVSKAIATLDFASHGRAGWQPRVSFSEHEAALFGRRGALDGESLFAEATDAVEVVRRLWDSWEDDAIVRNVTSSRYIDRDKLHYIDFVGEYFAIRGPSVTPRPPQGQPVVAVLAHQPRVYAFAAAGADLVFITPTDDDSLQAIRDDVNEAGGEALRVFVDIVASLSTSPLAPGVTMSSDALVFAGNADELADLILRWHDTGIAGVRLRPAVNAADLPVIVEQLVPLLQQAGRFRSAYLDGETLRQRLALGVAENRYPKASS